MPDQTYKLSMTTGDDGVLPRASLWVELDGQPEFSNRDHVQLTPDGARAAADDRVFRWKGRSQSPASVRGAKFLLFLDGSAPFTWSLLVKEGPDGRGDVVFEATNQPSARSYRVVRGFLR